MVGRADVIGLVGSLVTPTRGGQGPGEVTVRLAGGPETFFAWSPEPLPRGRSVLVVGARGDAHVDVVDWVDLPSPTPYS